MSELLRNRERKRGFMKSAFPVFIAFFAVAVGMDRLPQHVAQDDLVAKAQNERELIVYGTALAAQFDKFAEPFKRRYPFIKTQYSRTTGEALDVEDPARGVRPPAQCRRGADQQLHAPHLHEEKHHHELHAARRPATFRRDSSTSRAIGSAFTWFRTRSPTTPNSCRKPTRPRPSTICCSPNGRAASPSSEKNIWSPRRTCSISDKQKAIDYFKKLAQQDLILVNGHSKQAMLLTAGEFPIIIYSDIARTEELKRKGAPIEWVKSRAAYHGAGIGGDHPRSEASGRSEAVHELSRRR